jgi:hypothetical protein
MTGNPCTVDLSRGWYWTSQNSTRRLLTIPLLAFDRYQFPAESSVFRCERSVGRAQFVCLIVTFCGRKDEIVSQNSRFADSSQGQSGKDVPQELAELGLLIGAFPKTRKDELEIAFQRVVDSVHRRRRTLEVVQDALAQLRLDLKYLMFDLDATRRERDLLRQQMED